MVAFAMHLLRTVPGLREVSIHPDCEHGKRRRRRQFAVVPRTKVTETLAGRMAVRARAAGIEIALVDAQGIVFDVKPGA